MRLKLNFTSFLFFTFFLQVVSLKASLVEDSIHANQNYIDSLNNILPDSLNKNEVLTDSLYDNTDSISSDMLQSFETISQQGQELVLTISTDTLDAQVSYSAKDSIVYDIENRKVFLYGDAKATYKAIELTADYIIYDWSNSTLTAEMYKDDEGNPIGHTVFTENEEPYRAKKFIYNFKTKKGKAYKAIKEMTIQEQVYLHGETVKKNEYDEWYGYKGKFTTCNLPDPHFHIQAKRMKMVPDKVVATGPANLRVAGVPTPLMLPFGLFPIKKGERSGLLVGDYGADSQRGFNLRNWGYFFAISDYFNFRLTGDIYFNGSWGLKGYAQYNKRYKYSGYVNLDYGRDRVGEPESPDFNVRNDFRVNWQFIPDAKATRGSRFVANVNFGTSTYDKNFSYDRDRVLNNSLASKISFSKAWAGKPYSLSINVNHDQSFADHRVTLTLPVISFGVSRIQPFKGKVGGKRKWYESIGFSYRLDAKNVVSGKDSTFFRAETFRDAKYGMKHTIPINASFKVFKFFNLNPSVNYTERWYLQSVNKYWDPASATVNRDTLLQFKSVRNFNMALSLTTKLYGQLNFKGKKVKAIRHVFTPSLSLNYQPDFGKPFWGYYKTVQTDAEGGIATYSIFEPVNDVYGSPGKGMIGTVGLNLGNILEMKTFNRKDTVNNIRKIRILESFNVSAAYNIAADSLNFSTINISGRTSLVRNYLSMSFGVILDPYTVDSLGRRVNRSVWKDDRHFTRLTNANVSLSSTFRSKKADVITATESNYGTENEREMVEAQRDLYYDFNIPWSVSINYRFGVSRGELGNPRAYNIAYNSVDINFQTNVTPKWKVSISTGYDFNQLDFVYTSVTVIRDLHCWELLFDWVPYPISAQRYNIQVNVKSSLLQDLKLSRKKDNFTQVF